MTILRLFAYWIVAGLVVSLIVGGVIGAADLNDDDRGGR